MSIPDSIKDRGTTVVDLGGVRIGGGHPVAVQSMTNTPTADAGRTLRQIGRLARAGCEVVRVAVPNAEAAAALGKICARSPVPVVADVHFDHRLALAAVAAGVHGLRLNPGNIRSRRAVGEVIAAARDRGIPIRVGVNAGSVARDVRKKHGGATAEALVASALEHLTLLEDAGFTAIKVSLKASDVPTTVAACRLMRKTRPYPLHLGITEAGTAFSGLIKSAAGLGILLAEGIGDTIRISLAADPVEEVRAAWGLLGALGLRRRGVELIACPACARASYSVYKVAAAVERRLADLAAPIRVAVMGCCVNGPGEAREADLGCVGTVKGIQVYQRGKAVGVVAEGEVVKWLVENATKIARERARPSADDPRER
jgi:(E)-4-hydroxy-3-methylbut-2-enyl-diphosphate synthase